MLGSLFVLGLVALAAGQKCCMPAKFEVKEGETVAYVKDGKAGLLQALASVAFDGSSKKAAATLDGVNNGTTLHMKYIIDYQKGIKYTIVGEKCIQGPSGPFVPACIPDDAKVVTRYFFGLVDKPYYATSYHISMPGGGNAWVSVNEDCILMGAQSVGAAGGATYSSTVGYMNTTSGISDPSVFDVPSICEKEAVVLPKRNMGQTNFLLGVLDADVMEKLI